MSSRRKAVSRKRGTSVDYINLEDGRFSNTPEGTLPKFLDRIEKVGVSKLVIHFHGGLVSRAQALASASTLSSVYANATAAPLFVVWNSDLKSTIKNKWEEIAKESIFWALVSRIDALLHWKEAVDFDTISVARGRSGHSPRLASVTQPKRIRQAAESHGPPKNIRPLSAIQEREISEAMSRDPELSRQVRQIMPLTQGARGGLGGRGRATLMSPDVVRRLRADARPGARAIAFSPFLIKKIIMTLVAVIRRLRRGTHHGVYVTIVEEVLRSFYVANIGRSVWRAMKDMIADSFGADPSIYGGTALIEALIRWGNSSKREILLVGHSAGSIYILELIARLADKRLKSPIEVVFMAPACTMELMNHHRNAFRSLVSNFRIYSLSDALERGYWEVPLVYRASLLYMISGILEDKADTAILGMQRYFSGKRPYTDPIYQDMAELFQYRQCYSRSSVPAQLVCSATKHGGFDRDAGMEQSLTNISLHGIQ